MIPRPHFLFVTCQVGAEQAVKNELARTFPAARPAFARPGFLTFKLPEGHFLPLDFDLRLCFARAIGFSCGKVTGDDPAVLARQAWDLAPGRIFQRVHAWPRDAAAPGVHGFEPSITPAAVEAARLLCEACPEPQMLDAAAGDLGRPAKAGEAVLDCVLVEPNEWWIGFHQVRRGPGQWPGGMMPIELPPNAVSRAWLKMEEGLRWSRLPIPSAARCAELGSSPGGATQALLDRGCHVLGVDPAEMHPDVLGHPRFTHLRKRATQARRREFRKVRWLMADMNVAPNYTLDVVESIVTHPQVNVRGMLLTLKLFEWKLADEVPAYLERVRQWGFNRVRARQLPHNHQEICVAALRTPFVKAPRVSS